MQFQRKLCLTIRTKVGETKVRMIAITIKVMMKIFNLNQTKFLKMLEMIVTMVRGDMEMFKTKPAMTIKTLSRVIRPLSANSLIKEQKRKTKC